MPAQSRSKGFAHLGLILGIAIVVAAVAFGGWYVWDKNKDDKNGDDSSSSSRSQQNEKQVGNGSEFVAPEGWKLYKNDEAGLSFYYPLKVGRSTKE